MSRPPPRATLFPYTTLFRSRHRIGAATRLIVEAPIRRRAPLATVRGGWGATAACGDIRSEEHTSELQSRRDLVCRLLLEKKKAPRALGRRTVVFRSGQGHSR